MLLLVLILGMDQQLGIALTLDLLLGLLLALLMAYMDHEGLGHAHERQNQALDHYSQNLIWISAEATSSSCSGDGYSGSATSLLE